MRLLSRKKVYYLLISSCCNWNEAIQHVVRSLYIMKYNRYIIKIQIFLWSRRNKKRFSHAKRVNFQIIDFILPEISKAKLSWLRQTTNNGDRSQKNGKFDQINFRIAGCLEFKSRGVNAIFKQFVWMQTNIRIKLKVGERQSDRNQQTIYKRFGWKWDDMANHQFFI